ncbi:MAG: Asp-tRNA(Asn)/Glu-tRNA(Gln) amidotransferase subunit GatC [Gemmatimonadaceae bacterium]|nr:Asp-tRNA(Asn)/Glu-tRNA(Gln) amidotransferase subunit GatC [Gemmatimonadaceae bacterium]NUQ92970.1 Asp-tRNA(Asn)/Glu-tRNA(Gln) amidotransferase subunit GatC [Gemmatimonadaceae bacterium]NUR19609.1 Asp-tRNA(Asn)/Glu-tRNA(Gln) amidotransferase subunit GatC [Gemmatimonadaceae bacterium]NUS96479.1 Asp-tRNA(Asn)/Glu-tRNA(Gln) amidotransferase subunit GatC [Gemmatimonadaceae bacterium]
MAVTIDDVKHVARLARLGVTEERAGELVAELNGILGHMAALEKVDVEGVMAADGVGALGMPLRVDSGAPYPLRHPLDAFAPATRDGFILVPRLASHEDASEETE